MNRPQPSNGEAPSEERRKAQKHGDEHMNNETQQNTENAPTHVYLTAPTRRLWRGPAGVSKVASVQEPRANAHWQYRPKTTEAHIMDAAKGTPSGLLQAGLKGAGEKVQKELKNGLCDIVFAVGQMQENLPITVLDSTRRFGGLPVEVKDLTANMHRFLPSAPHIRHAKRKVPRSVCETAQHYLDETTRFLDEARKAFRELDAHLLSSDSLLALIDAQPANHFTLAIHENSKDDRQGDSVVGVLIPIEEIVPILDTLGLDSVQPLRVISDVYAPGGFPITWSERKGGHTLTLYQGRSDAFFAACEKAVEILAPVDAFVQDRALKMIAEVTAEEAEAVVQKQERGEIRNDDSERKEAARLRKVAAHRGLPRLKAYLSLLHSAESILLYGEPKEGLVAWLTGHIALLEENTDLMMDTDDHSLFWNSPNTETHDASDGPVTRDACDYTVTEVAETLDYADTLDRRFEERRAKREAALAEAERALAASQAIPEEIVDAFNAAVAEAAEVIEDKVQVWELRANLPSARWDQVSDDDRFNGLGLRGTEDDCEIHELTLRIDREAARAELHESVCVVTAPATLKGANMDGFEGLGSVYENEDDRETATLTLTYRCLPCKPGTRESFAAFGKSWLFPHWEQATVSNVEIVRAYPQEVTA